VTITTEGNENMAKNKNDAAATTAIEPVKASEIAPYSAEEQAFMVGLQTAGDGFAGFWDGHEGARIMGIYRGTQEVGLNKVRRIQIAFPVNVWADAATEGADSKVAPTGSIVAVWDKYQLGLLDEIDEGSKVVIIQGAKTETKKGNTVVNFTVLVEPNRVKRTDGASGQVGQDQTPF
jgi:hypothetical protein